MTITWDDFAKIDIRLGTIVEAAPFPEARKPALRLVVDFGPDIGTRKSSARITRHYSSDADGEVCLISVDPPAPNGGRLF